MGRWLGPRDSPRSNEEERYTHVYRAQAKCTAPTLLLSNPYLEINIGINLKLRCYLEISTFTAEPVKFTFSVV